MHTFTDNDNRRWSVAVTVGAIRRCRERAAVDLASLVDDGFRGLGELIDDPVKFAEVLRVLCGTAIEKAGVSPEDFEDSLAGDSLKDARDAFLSALADFFPEPQARDGLRRIVDANRRVMEALAAEGATAEITDDEIRAQVRRLIGSSAAAPASSDSTPAPSPSAN